MERKIIIEKTLNKLAKLQNRELDSLVEDIDKIYLKHKRSPYPDQNFPKDIVRFMQDYVTDAKFEQKDKLYLFNELKKKNMFNWDLNKNLEKAWRFIFKKWGLPNLNFS